MHFPSQENVPIGNIEPCEVTTVNAETRELWQARARMARNDVLPIAVLLAVLVLLVLIIVKILMSSAVSDAVNTALDEHDRKAAIVSTQEAQEQEFSVPEQQPTIIIIPQQVPGYAQAQPPTWYNPNDPYGLGALWAQGEICMP